MTTTPTAAPHPSGASAQGTRYLTVAATASSMSVAAHAAGGGNPSTAASVAVIAAATLVSAVVLRRAWRPTTGRVGGSALVGVVVLADQLVGHVLLHLEHLAAGGREAEPSAAHHAMPTGAHGGHDMSAMAHGGHEMGATSVSMLLPSPTMLAAHTLGAAVAGIVLAAVFLLADRVTAARHRALSRPRPPAAVTRRPRRPTAVLGTPTSGHVRLDRSRGPPPQLV